MLLGIEDVQRVAACMEASQDETLRKVGRSAHASPVTMAEALPTYLPWIDAVLTSIAMTCPRCKGNPPRSRWS